MTEANDRTTEFLARKPRMLGVLFVALLVLSHAATAAAKDSNKGTHGP